MKSYIITGLLFTMLLWGCKRDNDLFVSPNSPATVNPQTMLTNIEVNTFNNFESGLVKTGTIWVQQNAGTGGNWQAIEDYNITETDIDNYWNGIYSGTLLNCKLLSETYGAANPWYDGISKVLFAMNLGLATDAWGDVPYSQALQGLDGNFTPVYDRQEDVLKGIQTMLDEGIAQLSRPAADNRLQPGDDDRIFGGDVDLWIKTAWTLKARYANRLSLKDPSGSATLVLQYLQNGISATAEDCNAVHGNDGASQNQWLAFQEQNAQQILASASLVDSMSARTDDLRLYSLFDSTGIGSVVGSAPGLFDQDASPWGPYITALQIPLVSYVEVLFLQAEAHSRLGNAPDAANALNDAIEASALQVTSGAYDGSSIATYTAATTTLRSVISEKWMAMFGQMEGYNDWRRTGFPAILPNPTGVRSYIPQRFPNSLSERVSNPNTIVLPLDAKVWWAQP